MPGYCVEVNIGCIRHSILHCGKPPSLTTQGWIGESNLVKTYINFWAPQQRASMMVRNRFHKFSLHDWQELWISS